MPVDMNRGVTQPEKMKDTVGNPMGSDTIGYLRSLEAVRERCHRVLEAGTKDRLTCFTVHMENLPNAAAMIKELIKRDYGPIETSDELGGTLQRIPPHGRWRHFGQNNISGLISELRSRWNDDRLLVTRSILDLFMIAVLLDAGAGDAWRYKDASSEEVYCRSEGLAVATLRMFASGMFSSNPENPYQVDTKALQKLTEDDIINGFQVTEDNPLLGVTGRLELLQRLGMMVERQPSYFPHDAQGFSRPGSLLDHLLAKRSEDGSLAINALWEVVMEGLGGIWPASRTQLDGISLGDVWPCEALGGALVPFHKLSQWLTYSLMEPISKLMNIPFAGSEKMTGLAEYRNGGFFVDMGILTLKDTSAKEGLTTAEKLAGPMAKDIPLFPADSQAIIEWRALTVALLDRLAELLREQLSVGAAELPLANILEAGTWKAGRETSKRLRPKTSSPPIAIMSDGTLF